jgi:hypothetical protein
VTGAWDRSGVARRECTFRSSGASEFSSGSREGPNFFSKRRRDLSSQLQIFGGEPSQAGRCGDHVMLLLMIPNVGNSRYMIGFNVDVG